MKENKFWVIVNKKFPTTVTYKHDSWDSVESEAKRLARNNRNDEFIIMESIKSFKINEFVETEFVDESYDHWQDRDIPF
jgi:hypothetical protein